MVGHQLVVSLAYYNNNLALQLYFNGSTTCYLEEVMLVPKICYSESRWVHVHPLALACCAHAYIVSLNPPHEYCHMTLRIKSFSLDTTFNIIATMLHSPTLSSSCTDSTLYISRVMGFRKISNIWNDLQSHPRLFCYSVGRMISYACTAWLGSPTVTVT